MQVTAKLLMSLGATLLLVGLVLRLGGSKLGWLGHLPGDMRIGPVYFPLTTCILISIVLSAVSWLVSRFFGR